MKNIFDRQKGLNKFRMPLISDLKTSQIIAEQCKSCLSAMKEIYGEWSFVKSSMLVSMYSDSNFPPYFFIVT